MPKNKHLPKEFVESYADELPPWGPVGYITYKRTYARRIDKLNRTEEWNEHCARLVNGLVDLGAPYTEDELVDLYDTLFYMKGSVSGRAHWQLGTETVKRVGADSLQNCWHVAVKDLEAFCFTFDELMLGGGVGYNIQAEHVYELPRVRYKPSVNQVDTADCDFIVPDNREGWVELLRHVLRAYFITGKRVHYTTALVRHAGAKINGFGGVASGAGALVKGIQQICKILDRAHPRKLRPIDCLDIMNIIGSVVIAGNVRRSAQIALGDPFDPEFLSAKNWGSGSVPAWRAMSNNSIVTSTIADLPETFWGGYDGSGEPYGLINLEACRNYGRLADGLNYRPDPRVLGVNPCAEITLEDREACNLAEIYLPNIGTLKEFKEVAKLLYIACKTISRVPFSDPLSEAVSQRNHRIGIGLTGWMAAPKWRDANKLTQVYRHLEKADKHYSKIMGLNNSIKLTTVKPSGTLSLLPDNCPPGVHAAFGQYLIRRIRFAANDPLVDVCRAHGYHVEPVQQLDGSLDHGTLVVEFPLAYDEKTVTEDKCSVFDQLKQQQFLQTYWADNSVSATHYFRSEELDGIKDWLATNYTDGVKTASFLPALDHGFAQAPLEKITKKQYEALRDRTEPITCVDDVGGFDITGIECEGGHCPIK